MSSAILPCREYVKGNTVDKLAPNANDFWGSGTTMVLFAMTRPNGSQSTVAVADAGSFDEKELGQQSYFCHDQTGANLGKGVCIGAFEMAEDGTVSKTFGEIDGSTKIRSVYCYK